MLSATQIPAFSASNVSCAFGAYRIFGSIQDLYKKIYRYIDFYIDLGSTMVKSSKDGKYV